METVILKNGVEEAKPLVAFMTSLLFSLLEERPLALYDLVMKCRDENYQFFGDNEEHLKSLDIVDRDGLRGLRSGTANLTTNPSDDIMVLPDSQGYERYLCLYRAPA